MIQLTHINKTYRVGGKNISALSDINLNVEEGEIFGIIGHSGAGKSTLIRLLNLLERPDNGEVVIDKEDITRLATNDLLRVRRRIGMVFQHFNLLSSRTVEGNVRMALELSGEMNRQQQNERVAEMLDLVGLTPFRHQYPRQLSGGQKQRVGIARALAAKPRLLLYDEATSALDPQTTQSILDLLADVNRRFNLTVVLITHEMSVIRHLADRVAVIDKGQIVESGSVVDVFLHPIQQVTQSMVAEVSHNNELFESGLLSQVTGQVWRLTYVGDNVCQPILHDVAQHFNLCFILLQGTVSRLKEIPYGQLVVEWRGEDQALADARQYLIDQHVSIEEIH